MPRAEVVLWSKLKGRQVAGCKFRRQFSVGRFVLDFYCPEAKVAIEVDGETHGGAAMEARDRRRQTFVESFGIRFLRPTNDDIFHGLEGVLTAIQEMVEERLAENIGRKKPARIGSSSKEIEIACPSDPPKPPLSKGGIQRQTS